MLDLKNCKVDWDKEKFIPTKVYGFTTPTYSGKPQEIAQKFLKENLEGLKISVPLTNLKYEMTIESLGGWTVLFQQYQDETPIHSARVTILINKQKQIFMVKNTTIPQMISEKKAAKTAAAPLATSEIDAIIAKRAKDLGEIKTPIDKETMLYYLKGSLREVWKVKFGTAKPVGSWILFIDKYTGDILDERDVLWKTKPKGKVFIPNPVVTLNNDNLLDSDDKDQDILGAAYRKVELKNLSSDGTLKGV
jgi:Zn-dependent metalloprotease